MPYFLEQVDTNHELVTAVHALCWFLLIFRIYLLAQKWMEAVFFCPLPVKNVYMMHKSIHWKWIYIFSLAGLRRAH